MKHLYIFIISLLIIGSYNLLLNVSPIEAVTHVNHCFGAEGKVSIQNTPNGSVKVWCPHDIGSGQACQGDNEKSNSTDFNYSLTTCSCFQPDPPDPNRDGCLHIEVPLNCTYHKSGSTDACGVNDTKDISVDYTVECQPPPGQSTATPVPATPVPGGATNTPVPGQPTETPIPGQPTETPTPGSACAQPCTNKGDTYCQSFNNGNSAGCTACRPTNGDTSNMTCQPPTSSQPTPTSPANYVCRPNVTTCSENACGISGSASCSTCNGGMCLGGKCQSCAPVPTGHPTPTTPPPTPTPTPAFNCKCGDITTQSAIIPGTSITVVGHALLLGADRGNAHIPSLRFEVAGGTNTSGDILPGGDSGAVPAHFTVTKGDADVYEASATLPIPKEVTDGRIYKIFIPSSSIQCEAKNKAAGMASPQSVVLGANTQDIPTAQKPNFFQRIGTFFSSLFNNQSHQSVRQLWSAANIIPPLGQKNSLIEDTFKIAHTSIQTDANSCKFIQFQYK